MDVRIAEPRQTPSSLWQTALDQSVSGILVYKAVRAASGAIDTFLIQLANRRAEQIIGMDRDEMLGRTTSELFPNTHSTPLWTDIAGVIDSGVAKHTEIFFRVSRTNKEQWFDLGIEPFGDGEQAVVSFNDITDLKMAQQTMLGESILFKALSSTVPGMCVVVVNFFQKVIFANGELPGLFISRHADDVLDRRISDTMVTAYRADWKQHISSSLTGGQHSFGDQWDGCRYECYVGPVRNERGNIVMAICVYRDVSEQFRQQQALQRLNTDLQRSNHSLEQFAYVASHDLQEPLRKIKSFGDMLNSQYADNLGERGANMVQRMQSAADRMNDLIKSLLSYARINTPVTDSQIQSAVSLNKIVDGVVADLEMVIDDRKARVTVGSHLPMVPGDATQLRQLFQNLLTNAMKFTRAGQQPEVNVTGVVVTGKSIPDFPGVDPFGEYAHISIQDNGIGIAPEYFDTIFGLFSRLHNRHQYAGTGIGLATCRRVAENHGGTITVESKVDVGTTFHVYLPLQIPERVIP